MRFSDQFLRTLRDRVSIVGYAGGKLTWDRRKSQPAKGDMWACCPFHGEKSASFHVLDAKGLFHCFGCQESGDVIGLAMKLEGLNFPEAVERLAEGAGLALPPREGSEDRAAPDRRKGLLAAVAKVEAFYARALRGPEGAGARAYLLKRGLPEDVWARFGLGYAPSGWTSAIEALKAEGFDLRTLVEAGIAKDSEGRRPIDAFRDRIIFPIADAQGRTIAFGGRALDPAAPAKYINSAETELFHKGRTLYRLKQAREVLARAKGAGLIVAEGYLDVIAFERAGLPAVAPLGTALTEDQLELVWRSGGEPILCFDGDAAGLKAADRALDLALPQLSPARTVRIALLPQGDDPDDVYRKQGAGALAPLIASAQPAVERLFAREANRAPLSTPEAKAAFKKRLKDACALIRDEETRRQYLRDLLGRADAALGQGPREKKPWTPRPPGQPPGKWRPPPPPPTGELLAAKDRRRNAVETDVLRAATDNPRLVALGFEALAAAQIGDVELDRVRHALLDMTLEGTPVDRRALSNHLRGRGLERAAERVSAWLPSLSDAASASPDDRALFDKQWMAQLALLAANTDPDEPAVGAPVPDGDVDAFARAEARLRAKLDADRQARGAPPASPADGG